MFDISGDGLTLVKL